MSGDSIFLVDAADGSVSALVRASGIVVEHAGLPVALIGGLAVTCRLATAHRPTQDVDMVTETSADLIAGSRTTAQNLISAGVAQADPSATSTRLYVGSTKVELIETEHLEPGDSDDIESEKALLFVLAHRWALESAEPMTISVVNTDVRSTVPVATPAALVAMKLHSIQDRSEDRKCLSSPRTRRKTPHRINLMIDQLAASSSAFTSFSIDSPESTRSRALVSDSVLM